MQFIKRVIKAFKQALEETVRRRSLEQEFIEEIAKRRIANRKMFINTTKEFIKDKCLEDTGVVMDDTQAKVFAINMFEQAKKKGDLDILNRLKGEYYD